MELKVCPKCHLELPIADFVTLNKRTGYRRPHCRACENARVRQYYADNPEYRAECKARSAAWAKENPDRMIVHQRKSSLKFLYGLSQDQYDALMIAQCNCCALCHTDNPGRGSRGHWMVDHCHKGKHVRGLLCHKCNTLLGSYEALMERIGESALLDDYLTRPSPILAINSVVDAPKPAPRFVAVLPEKPAFVAAQCSVEGCENDTMARGFCQKHYARFLRRDGDVGGADNLPHQTPRGASHPKSKLTEEHVREIRASDESGVALAAKFGVTTTLISNVRLRKVWKDVA